MKSVCKRFCPFILAVGLIVLFSCQKRIYPTVDFFAMDTYISLQADGASEEDFLCVKSYIQTLENTYSRTNSDSEISKINAGSRVEVSEECAELLLRAKQAETATGGAFNPCLGALSDLWDITGKKHIPTESELAAVLPATGCSFTVSGTTVVKTDPNAQLDLGAAVKGYAAEKALKLLKERGVANAMLSLGGNIAVCGHAASRSDGWLIGVRSPYDPESLALTFTDTDCIVAVSGDYERYFEENGVRYHHIFDPTTGKPARTGLRSTVVIAHDGLNADILSTALFVMGEEKAAAFYQSDAFDFEAILFTDDGRVLATEGIQSKISLLPGAQTEDARPLTLLPLEKTH